MKWESEDKKVNDEIEDLLHSCDTLLHHEPTIHGLAISCILETVEDMISKGLAIVYKRDVWHVDIMDPDNDRTLSFTL